VAFAVRDDVAAALGAVLLEVYLEGEVAAVVAAVVVALVGALAAVVVDLVVVGALLAVEVPGVAAHRGMMVVAGLGQRPHPVRPIRCSWLPWRLSGPPLRRRCLLLPLSREERSTQPALLTPLIPVFPAQERGLKAAVDLGAHARCHLAFTMMLPRTAYFPSAAGVTVAGLVVAAIPWRRGNRLWQPLAATTAGSRRPGSLAP
jgi:hypothetical protein